MKRLIAGISLLIFLLPQGAWADPSPGIQWLQNEPLTLFDYGMYKANKELERLAKDIQDRNQNKLNTLKIWIKNIRKFEEKIKKTEDETAKAELPELISSNKIMLSDDLKRHNYMQFINFKFAWADYNFEKNAFEFGIAFNAITEFGPNYETIPQKPEKTVNNENCKTILEDLNRSLGIKYLGAERIISQWFSHAGFKNSSRPKDLEEEVVRNSQLKITLFYDEHNVSKNLSCYMPLAGGSISFKEAER